MVFGGPLLIAAISALSERPCDIYEKAGTPCVAAHSMVRALYSEYNGTLYTISRASDNTTKAIGVTSDGYADAAAQIAFCMDPSPTVCTVEQISDQSGRGNHLDRVIIAPHPTNDWPKRGINAMRDPVSVGGNTVFSAYFEGGQFDRGSGTMGFRSNRLNGNASGTAINDEPESMYAVVSGEHFDAGCCFDYGNSEVVKCGYPGVPPCGVPKEMSQPPEKVVATGSPSSVPPPPGCAVGGGKGGCGMMESIYWGAVNNGPTHSATGDKHPGSGVGPWVMADLESGVWGGNDPSENTQNTPMNGSKFVTAMLKGKPGHWQLKGGDAQSGQLNIKFDGPRPLGYEVMQKKGAIVLGIGGDNSDLGQGTFYEGALTASYTSEVTDALVQANIIAAGYGK